MSLENNQLEYLQDLREDFDYFLKSKNWEQCRAVLRAMEEFRVNTSELRREMNLKMAEPELNLSTAEGVNEFMKRVNKFIHGV